MPQEGEVKPQSSGLTSQVKEIILNEKLLNQAWPWCSTTSRAAVILTSPTLDVTISGSNEGIINSLIQQPKER